MNATSYRKTKQAILEEIKTIREIARELLDKDALANRGYERRLRRSADIIGIEIVEMMK